MRGSLAALVVGVSLLAPIRASAQDAAELLDATEQERADAPEDPKITEARALFVQGSSLAKQERWREALAAFERSAAVREHAVTTYNLGYCERALGNFTRALKWFRKAVADDASRGGSELKDEVRVSLERHARELSSVVPRLHVVMQDHTNRLSIDATPLEVFEQGDPIVLAAGTRPRGEPETPPAARFSVLVDAGEHVLRVVDRAGRSYEIRLTLAPGERRQIAIHPVPAGPPAQRTPAPASSPSTVASERPVDASRPAWPWIAIGVGTTSLVGAAVLGLAAKSNRDELSQNCPRDPCDIKLRDEQDRANLYSAFSLVALGTGAVAVAAGTLTLLSGRDSERTAAAHRRWELTGNLTPSSATLALGGRL